MPLQPPALDDRSFDDLLQDLVASIPAHTPEWASPPPVGDPGRTLLELFAWLGDALLYRANLVPERQRLTFLKLLGMPLQAATAARGLIMLAGDPSVTTAQSIAPSAKVNGPVTFETLGGMDLLPVVAQVFRKAPLTKEQKAEAQSLLTGLQSLYKMGAAPTGYYTKQVFANDIADRTGIDLAQDTLDQSLWIALLTPKAGAKTDDIRDALAGKNTVPRILNVGFVPAIDLPNPFSDIGPRAAVQRSWQLTLTPKSDGTPRFAELKVFDDTTQGLTRPGVVRLVLPQVDVIGFPPNDVKQDAQAGVGPKPPRIDDLEIQQRLVTWVRLKAATNLRVSWLGVNAAEIDQRGTNQAVTLGVSDGSANQQFGLGVRQVDTDSFELEVDMPGIGPQLWSRVDDLNSLPGPVPSYVLDPEAGTVTFGDNLRGMIPHLGRRVRVRKMRAGGGGAGNLPAGTLKAMTARDPSGNVIGQKITVKQPIATTGGGDAENVLAAEKRIPAWLRHRDRAVTADDYRSLAESIRGASIGRVEVLPLFKPQTRTADVPGVVSVMVIPQKDGFQPPCPRADRPLLETTFAYLNPRKPTAAELYVIASDYVGMGISIAIEVLAGFDLRVVSQEVEDALRRYLWPLEPGGVAQAGWPLGRGVRALELEVVASQVHGVVEVNELQLFTLQPDKTYRQVTSGATGREEISLESYQFPELLQVKVVAGADGSGVSAGPIEPEPEQTNDVAVPVVPKVC